MPTTELGVPYTVRTALVDGDPTYWGVADAVAANPAPIPTVLYCHGAGGTADQFAITNGFKGIREWMINNGVMWIEGLGGSSTNWGNDLAVDLYEKKRDHVNAWHALGPVVLFGRSMGGLPSARLYVQGSHEYAGWINSSGVSTVGVGVLDPGAPGVEKASAQYFSTMLPAWNASTPAEVVANFGDDAPETWPASVWAGKKILSLFGETDASVPWRPRGAGVLTDIWGDVPAVSIVKSTPGGHDQATGTFTMTKEMSAFLTDVFAMVTPEVPTELLFNRGRFIYENGQAYRLTRRI